MLTLPRWSSVDFSEVDGQFTVFWDSFILALETLGGVQFIPTCFCHLASLHIQELKLLLGLGELFVGSIININSVVVLLRKRSVHHAWILSLLIWFFLCNSILVELRSFYWNNLRCRIRAMEWFSNINGRWWTVWSSLTNWLLKSVLFLPEILHLNWLWSIIWVGLMTLWYIHFLDIWLERFTLIVCDRRVSVVARLVYISLSTSATTSDVVSITAHENVITVNGLSYMSLFYHPIDTLISTIVGYLNTTSSGSSSSLIVLKEVADSWFRIWRELTNRGHSLVMLLVWMVACVWIVLVRILLMVMNRHMAVSISLWSVLTSIRRGSSVSMASIWCLGEVFSPCLVMSLHFTLCVVSHLVLIIHHLWCFEIMSIGILVGYWCVWLSWSHIWNWWCKSCPNMLVDILMSWR